MVLSRLLGHHSPDFTLRVYAHLVPGDETPVLDLEAELGQGGNEVATDGTGIDPIRAEEVLAETPA